MLIMEVKGVVKRELLILKTCLRTSQKYVFLCVIGDIFVDLVKNTLLVKSLSVYLSVHSFQIYEYISIWLFFLRQNLT